MEQDRLVLGFDAREMGLARETAWDDQRKRAWQLFRLEVGLPLSIDTCVWPSLFDRYEALRPGWTGPYPDLWENLTQLETCLNNHDELRVRQYAVVAFAVMTNMCNPENLAVWADFFACAYPGDVSAPQSTPTPLTHPSTIEPSWLFLGYDVADRWGTSALITMRIPGDTDNIEALRVRWGPHLNGAHLFEDLSQAGAFKDFSNPRISEHAPFFVYGLWLVRKQ